MRSVAWGPTIWTPRILPIPGVGNDLDLADDLTHGLGFAEGSKLETVGPEFKAFFFGLAFSQPHIGQTSQEK